MAVQAIMKVLHNVEPDYPGELKAEIVAAVGNLGHIELWGEEVLVAPFIKPGKTKGGLIIGGKEQKEDQWQGKSFLILKLGHKAAEISKSRGKDRELHVGDWGFGFPQEGSHLSVRGPGFKMAKSKDFDGEVRQVREWEGWPCRLVLIGDIRGRTTRPQDIQ